MIYEISPRNQYGKDFIGSWENFLTPEDINLILAQPEWVQSEEATVTDGNRINETHYDQRSAKIGWLLPKNGMIHVWEKITDAVAQINRINFHYDLTGIYEPIQLGIYSAEEKSHHEWHMDMGVTGRDVPRKLSMSLLLSDPSEFEGGELIVKTPTNEDYVLEQAKGRAWFFPSYTLHKVAPVTKGVRRTLVLWAGGPAFR